MKIYLSIFRVFFLFALVFSGNIYAQHPGGVTGASLWLKADAGAANSGGNLTGWTDQTGTNTFTKTGTIGYLTNSVNFNPAVSFNNTDAVTVLPSNRLDGNTNITYVDGFAVYKHTNNNSNFLGGVEHGNNYGIAVFASFGVNTAYVGNGTTSTYSHFTATGLTNSFSLINLDVSSTTSPYVTGSFNAVSQTVTTSGGDYANIIFKPMIGGTNNNGDSYGWPHAIGEVAEIVLYPSSLNPLQKQRVESYLALKYGISLGNNTETPFYVNSAGTIIYANSTYKYDVFGIGKDDGSGLNQASSNNMNTGSGDGTGQSGKGNIVLGNASSLGDNDFLIVGHDNGALTYSGTELPGEWSEYRRVAREWLVKKTNDPGTVTLTFNMAGISGITVGGGAADYAILLDADANFSSGATKVDASSLSGNVITFTGLTLADGQHFTFAAKESALPVELASFSGDFNNNKVLIKWATSTEINNFGFNIEKSMLSPANLPLSWETIGFVKGNGNSNSPRNYSFIDENIFNGKFAYRLKQIDSDGKYKYSPQIELDLELLPKDFALYQNYPNPFNPSTAINFDLPVDADVTLEIFSILGKKVGTLVNERMKAGKQQVVFDGMGLSSGLYIYSIRANDFRSIKKMVLIK